MASQSSSRQPSGGAHVVQKTNSKMAAKSNVTALNRHPYGGLGRVQRKVLRLGLFQIRQSTWLGLGLNTIFDAILLASILGAVGRGVASPGLSSAGSRTC